MDGWSLGVISKGDKRVLKSVRNDQLIRGDWLILILVQIEGTINSRPLTSISDDTDALTVLTPNHFISGRSSNAQGVIYINEKDIDSRRKWKVVESLSNVYWKRLIKEYIPSLNIRKKNGIKSNETLK